MISFKSKNALRACLVCCGFATAFVACSDWTDHYEADSAVMETQHQTLWEYIDSSQDLTKFKSLLQKTGYDAVLNNTQTYTVWAPADGTYDYDALDRLDNSRLVREFVENHVARNNYPASGMVDKLLYAINEKRMHFGGNQQYNIQNVGLSKANVATSNGTLHVLNGQIPFMANLYESLNNNDHPIDSIANYYHSFDERELNIYRSVQGPIVDGQLTYLDSIFDERNELYSYFWAFINREDSNYTMIVPTNEAWIKAKEQISKCYKYLPSFEFQEFTSTSTTKTPVSIRDVDSLTNAIVNNMLMSDLFYNNNLYDNKKLNTLQTGQKLQADSLISTGMTKVYTEDAADMFEGAVRYNKSNGAMWLTDSLRFRPWHKWNPELVIQLENHSLVATLDNVYDDHEQTFVVTPGTQNPKVPGHVSNDVYVELTQASSAVNPAAAFYLPGVRSTTYSVYIVTVPANIVSDNFEPKPYCFSVSMGYADEEGKHKDKVSDWCVERTYVCDSSRVDTVYLGDFTFPIAYYQTGNFYPYLRVNSQVNRANKDRFDRTMRFDCIILRPKEFDLYIKEHPDYKFDRGEY